MIIKSDLVSNVNQLNQYWNISSDENRLSKLIIVDKWQEIGREGDRPPPCSRFSFNKIDRQRALLFGGKQDKYKTTYKDVYILDLETKVCIKYLQYNS